MKPICNNFTLMFFVAVVKLKVRTHIWNKPKQQHFHFDVSKCCATTCSAVFWAKPSWSLHTAIKRVLRDEAQTEFLSAGASKPSSLHTTTHRRRHRPQRKAPPQCCLLDAYWKLQPALSVLLFTAACRTRACTILHLRI